jgi:hypothetical protein
MATDHPRSPDMVEDAIGRLCEAISILDAIETGGMLAELPVDDIARDAHQRAVSLLAVLRRELTALRCELQAAGEAQEAIARAVARARPDDAPRRAPP